MAGVFFVNRLLQICVGAEAGARVWSTDLCRASNELVGDEKMPLKLACYKFRPHHESSWRKEEDNEIVFALFLVSRSHLYASGNMLKIVSRKSLPALRGWGAENTSIRRRFSSESGRLAGKVALITGGASGIGKATAAEFIRNGAKVILADVQRQLGEQTAAELGPNAAFVHCNVTQEPDVAGAVDFAVSTHGGLDIMYNNAGISGSVIAAGIAELDVEEFDRVLRVNLRGVVVGMKHAARVMIPRGRGCILCTASVTGILGGLAHHTYSISKFAVAGTVRSVASELRKHGIRVNCISPPALPTALATSGLLELYPGMQEGVAVKIIEGAGELKGAKCEAEDIAKAALYLASEEGRYVSGHNLVVDGGFTTYKSFPFPSPEELMK